MNTFIKMFLVIMLIPAYARSQDACSLSIKGGVYDADTRQSLPFAAIYIQANEGVTADGSGNYQVHALCPGKYTLICMLLGYKTDTVTLAIAGNTTQHFYLKPEATTITEVEVEGKRDDDRALVSQSVAEIANEELISMRGTSLGEALKSVPGVYTLQSGPTIFKPVIHGLHSNRILIFNNGVRQEGQQWGSEHAPEIDPFVATRLSVIRGAASIRYGSDAIGGVILVEPPPANATPGVRGEVNIVGASNNRMGVTSGILQGAFGKKLTGLTWSLQGTYRRAGNSKTPHYYLENSGFQEGNFSGSLGYKRKNYGGDIYYSEFNTKLGIFTGTHAETISDLQAAIERPEPITPSYFSYKIDRPYQQVKHQLAKASAFYIFRNESRLDVIVARQQNERSEYDFVPLSGRLNPELYLRLVTHTADILYKHAAIGKYTGTLGFNGITQGNVRQYEMLIPNFRNYGGGIFYIGKWTSDRLVLEAGARYDYRWLRVYTLDNNTAQVVTPTWDFNNVTGTIGSQYYLKPNLSWAVNIGTAWRAPTVNELMSQGVHQSAVAYEIGNPNLHSERAYNFSTSLHYHSDRFHGELGLYNNIIDGYIFLKPDLKYIHTIRGSYPTFTYTQVNARFRGVDLSGTYNLTDSLSLTGKVSLLYAWNKTIHDYLQLIPGNRFEASLRYGLGNYGSLRQVYISVTDIYTARQKLVPANSDYLAPPAAYMLLNANVGFSVPVNSQMVNISVSVNNILDVAYRDYMDRFRYFTDEPGRNFTLRVRVPFAIAQPNHK
ncbi:MAG TPA: TonB-dependent receptor [Ohtaekwangia sp.]|uniref:TonB-dependent receptor n=1 Tax=Ohtaekwangia sp. TaxID=2066019 RepID=UPI002F939E0B